MKYLQQSGLFVIGRFVPSGVGLAGVAIYTRLLDPTVMGEYALLISTIYLISAVIFSWLRTAALRFVAGSDGSDLGSILSTVFWTFVVVSAVIAPIVLLGLRVVQSTLSWWSVALVPVAVVALAWNDLNAALLQAQLSVRAWTFLNLARSVGTLVAAVALILAGFRLEALLAGFVLGNLSVVLFAGIWRGIVTAAPDLGLMIRYLRFGWPQSVNAGLSYGASVGQRSFLAAGTGTAALGVFSVLQNFGTLTLSGLIGSVSVAGMPRAFKAKDRHDAAGVERQLGMTASLIFAVALPATIGLCILATPISHVVFGPRFWNGASIILALVAIAECANSIRIYYFDQSFELAMNTRPQAIISGLGTAILIATCALLIPQYGAPGAAVSAVAANVACLIFSIAWSACLFPMPIPFTDLLKTVFASLGMGATLFLLPRGTTIVCLVGDIVAGVVIYALLSAVLRMDLIREHLGQRSAAFES